MVEQKPPPWEDDSLSKFFELAEYNERVTSLNFPSIFELLKEVDSVFKKVQEAIEHDSKPEMLVPRFLIIRTHSSFLAAIRLAMSGQIAESFPVLRQAIEQAWYALHISKDPSPPSRMEIWLCRNDDDMAKAKCKQEFTIANVRTTHEALDSHTAVQLKELYETMIDFGAHPNQLGVLASIAHSKTVNRINYQVGILAPKPIAILMTVRMAVSVAIGALKIFQNIFPERFEIMGIYSKIEELVGKVNSVFKPFVNNKP